MKPTTKKNILSKIEAQINYKKEIDLKQKKNSIKFTVAHFKKN